MSPLHQFGVSEWKQSCLMNNFHITRFFTLVCASAVLTLSSAAAETRTQTAPKAPGRAGSDVDAKLDLNTADRKALEAVPVIGPDGAQAIVAGRPFATIDDLDRVKGISAERLEQIRAKVMVGTHHAPAKVGMPTVAPTRSASASESTKEKIDVNKADQNTLEAIPSIGAETAREIIAARPFATLEDLSRIKGISTERLEQIRAHLKVTTP